MRRLDIYNLQAVDDVSSHENALSDVEGASDILVAISVLYRNVCHTRRVAKKQFLSFIGIHDFQASLRAILPAMRVRSIASSSVAPEARADAVAPPILRAGGLLALTKTAENIFNEWELTFLQDMAERSAAIIALSPKERKEFKFSARQAEALLALRDFRLTSRQAETLFEIRDTATLHRDIKGVSVTKLIARCYEARLDLGEDDEEFIVGKAFS
jgi:hypothetical protein